MAVAPTSVVAAHDPEGAGERGNHAIWADATDGVVEGVSDKDIACRIDGDEDQSAGDIFPGGRHNRQ